MATREKIFEFDATQDIDNLRKLREEIKDLKKVMEELEIGSREYAETSDRLFAKQSRLAELMKEHKRPVEDVAGSFNRLNAQLRTLKERWKATGDEMERSALTEEINKVKGQMNAMNESIGNYQHNVGNYKNAIIDAFTQMGIASTALDPHLKKVGVDISSVTNYIKIMQVTVNQFSFKGIIAGFNSATVSVRAFIAGLSGIQKALLATGIGAFIVLLGALIAHWSDLNTWLGKVTDSQHAFTLELNKTTKAIDSLSLRIAEFNKDQEAIERQRKKLFEGWTDSDFAKEEVQKAEKLQKEAMDMLDKASAEKDEASRRLKEAQEKYDNAIDEEAKQVYEQDLADRLKNWAKATNNFNEAARQAGEASRAVKNMQQNLANVEKAAEGAADKTTKFGAAAKQVMEDFSEVQKQIDAAVNNSSKAQEEYDAGLAKALELQKQLQEGQLSELELEDLNYKERLKLFEQYGLDTELLEEEHQERMAEIRAEEARKANAQIAEQAAEKKKKDDEAEANYQKLMKARETATKNMASGTTSILNAAAKAVGENTKLGKGFAIAAATIDTIASAVAGFRAGMNQWADAGPMAWMAPVQAALNATMALTAGFAEVQKIRSVDTSGNSNAGGGMATAMAIPNIEGLSTPMDYTRQVVTDTEREEMNQDSRVYILESDIQQSNNRVRVREEETTF